MKLFLVLAIVSFSGVCYAAETTTGKPREWPQHTDHLDPKETLIERGENLTKKVDATVKNLEGQNDLVNIQALKAGQAAIHKLIVELQATTDVAKVDALKKLLSVEIHKLGHKNGVLTNNVLHPHPSDQHVPTVAVFKREVVTPTPAPADHAHPQHNADALPVETLIANAEALIKKVDVTIAKLVADKNGTAELAIFQLEEATLKKLITELKATTDPAQVLLLKNQLNGATHKLGHHNGVFNGNVREPKPSEQHVPTVVVGKREVVTPTPAPADHAHPQHNADALSVETLIANAEALIKKVDVTIAKLVADKNGAAELAIFQSEEATLKKLIAELKATTDPAKVLLLKNQLNGATHKLGHHNGVFNGNVREPPKQN